MDGSPRRARHSGAERARAALSGRHIRHSASRITDTSVHSIVSASQYSSFTLSSLLMSKEILLGPHVKPSIFPLLPAIISLQRQVSNLCGQSVGRAGGPHGGHTHAR